MSRADYLNECMSDFPTTPMDAFNLTWCVRCPNSTCSRSAASNHLFVHKADGWKDALFNKVKRASEDDPAFAAIRSRAFIGKEPDGGERAQVPEIASPKFFQPLSVEEESSGEEAPPDTDREPVVESVEPVVEVRLSPPSPANAVNTPFMQGTVLPGGPTSIPAGEGQSTYTFGEEDE